MRQWCRSTPINYYFIFTHNTPTPIWRRWALKSGPSNRPAEFRTVGGDNTPSDPSIYNGHAECRSAPRRAARRRRNRPETPPWPSCEPVAATLTPELGQRRPRSIKKKSPAPPRRSAATRQWIKSRDHRMQNSAWLNDAGREMIVGCVIAARSCYEVRLD